MSFGPQIVMPGALHFDSPAEGTSRSGLHSGIFRPPTSPSASSSLNLGRSTASLRSTTTTPAPYAKRNRPQARESTPLTEWTFAGDANLTADSTAEELAEVEEQQRGGGRQYVLAGQIETPGGVIRNDPMEDSVYSDVDYRRGLGAGTKRPHDELEPPRLPRPADEPTADGRVGRFSGWGTFAFSTIGGVVGKVWEFCTAGAFRGFHAGGGTGYDVRPTTPVASTTADPTTTSSSAVPNGQVWCNEHDVPTLPEIPTPMAPGGFPQSDYAPFYYEQESPETLSRPAKRRMLTDETPAGEELRRNWVVVPPEAEKERRPSLASQASISSLNSRPVAPPLNRRISKPVSRLSTTTYSQSYNQTYGQSYEQSSGGDHAGTASLASREPASFASPRSPQSKTTSPNRGLSRLPIPSRPQTPSAVSPTHFLPPASRIPTPTILANSGHRRAHSNASATASSPRPSTMRPRSSFCGEPQHYHSPRLDAEAKRLAAARRREEREAELQFNGLSARIQDMIREGNAALRSSAPEEEMSLDD
ncbi:hypothetical protein F4780DRAFT_200854 [Xylariomycetidae sp. FL0641]|nr:hypothetical protein F4780DRAFT_200854 [Xylariomycetidae sp. FL0641]